MEHPSNDGRFYFAVLTALILWASAVLAVNGYRLICAARLP
jgi:hypothetical protein